MFVASFNAVSYGFNFILIIYIVKTNGFFKKKIVEKERIKKKIKLVWMRKKERNDQKNEWTRRTENAFEKDQIDWVVATTSLCLCLCNVYIFI